MGTPNKFFNKISVILVFFLSFLGFVSLFFVKGQNVALSRINLCAENGPFANISASPTSVAYGGSATITWSSSCASSCYVSPSGWTGRSGSQSTGALTSSRTYTVSCSGINGSASANATVSVSAPPAPTALIQANSVTVSTTVPYGSNVVISWSSTNSNSCSITPTGWTGTSGMQTVNNIIASATYILTCTGTAGTASSQVIVNVLPSPSRMYLFWTSSTTPPQGWTSVSDNSLQAAYQRFIRINSSQFGARGGGTTHTFSGTSGPPIQAWYGGSLGDAGSVSSVAGNNHVHASFMNSTPGNSIPPFYNVQIIKSNSSTLTQLPSGIAALFLTSAVPSGWTIINNINEYFLKGSSAADVGRTGGSATHFHSASSSLGLTSGATQLNGGFAGGCCGFLQDPNHVHQGMTQSDSQSDIPLYTNFVLAQLNSATSTIPQGMVSLFDGDPGSGWQVIKNQDSRYIRIDSANPGFQGGSATHTHGIVNTGSIDQRINIGWGNSLVYSYYNVGSHYHAVTPLPAPNLPPYREFILAQKVADGTPSNFTGLNQSADFFLSTSILQGTKASFACPFNVKGTTHVISSCYISQNLTAAVVQGDVSIDNGSTIQMEPGTTFIFNPGQQILLSGYILKPYRTAIIRKSIYSLDPALTFTANPTNVSKGAQTTLTWTGANLTSCVASGGTADWTNGWNSSVTSGTKQVIPFP